MAIKNSRYKVGETCHRVYWNIVEDGWCIQQVVVQEVKCIDGAYRFRVGKDNWTDYASLFKNYRAALSNQVFRKRQSHSIRDVDF